MNKPLTPKDCDLRGMPFMPLDVVRLIDSDLFAISTGDEFKAAVALWCKAWLQVPAASLPTDDRILAHLSGAGGKWKKVKEIALRGWVLCEDGRLYHPVIADKAIEAMDRRKEHEEHKSNELNRKKQEREDRKRMFETLRSHGIVKPYDTTTAQLRLLVSQLQLQQKQQPVTDLSRGQVQDCHAQVTAKTGTGTGTGTGNNNINTSSSTREEIFLDPPDTRKKFKMFFDWEPSPNFLTDRKGYGFDAGLLTKPVLSEFVGYWSSKNEILTQGEWEHKFATNLVKLTKTPQVAGTVRKSTIPDNNTDDWMSPELLAMLEVQREHAN